jgi:hypothetical protein
MLSLPLQLTVSGKPFRASVVGSGDATGKYRYYDGLLMMLGLLQSEGNFRILSRLCT